MPPAAAVDIQPTTANEGKPSAVYHKGNLTIRKLAPHIGALVTGADLTKPLDKETRDAIEAAVIEHGVIFFENQHITPEQQKEFGLQFAPHGLHVHPLSRGFNQVGDATPETFILDSDVLTKYSKDGGSRYRDNTWHTDVTFEANPPLGAVLVPRVLPSVGGDTHWGSLIAAYEALSEPVKRLADSLQAEHSFTYAFAEEFYAQYKNAEGPLKKIWENWVAAKDSLPPVVHPVVRTHPVSGKKGLFVNKIFTKKIVGVSDTESKHILSLFFEHSQHAEFTVRWSWKLGDVAFWDNRLTQHRATADFDATKERRVVHRITLAGDKPF